MAGEGNQLKFFEKIELFFAGLAVLQKFHDMIEGDVSVTDRFKTGQ